MGEDTKDNLLGRRWTQQEEAAAREEATNNTKQHKAEAARERGSTNVCEKLLLLCVRRSKEKGTRNKKQSWGRRGRAMHGGRENWEQLQRKSVLPTKQYGKNPDPQSIGHHLSCSAATPTPPRAGSGSTLPLTRSGFCSFWIYVFFWVWTWIWL